MDSPASPAKEKGWLQGSFAPAPGIAKDFEERKSVYTLCSLE
jgi:hypothetical protein